MVDIVKLVIWLYPQMFKDIDQKLQA